MTYYRNFSVSHKIIEPGLNVPESKIQVMHCDLRTGDSAYLAKITIIVHLLGNNL